MFSGGQFFCVVLILWSTCQHSRLDLQFYVFLRDAQHWWLQRLSWGLRTPFRGHYKIPTRTREAIFWDHLQEIWKLLGTLQIFFMIDNRNHCFSTPNWTRFAVLLQFFIFELSFLLDCLSSCLSCFLMVFCGWQNEKHLAAMASHLLIAASSQLPTILQGHRTGNRFFRIFASGTFFECGNY